MEREDWLDLSQVTLVEGHESLDVIAREFEEDVRPPVPRPAYRAAGIPVRNTRHDLTSGAPSSAAFSTLATPVEASPAAGKASQPQGNASQAIWSEPPVFPDELVDELADGPGPTGTVVMPSQYADSASSSASEAPRAAWNSMPPPQVREVHALSAGLPGSGGARADLNDRHVSHAVPPFIPPHSGAVAQNPSASLRSIAERELPRAAAAGHRDMASASPPPPVLDPDLLLALGLPVFDLPPTPQEAPPPIAKAASSRRVEPPVIAHPEVLKPGPVAAIKPAADKLSPSGEDEELDTFVFMPLTGDETPSEASQLGFLDAVPALKSHPTPPPSAGPEPSRRSRPEPESTTPPPAPGPILPELYEEEGDPSKVFSGGVPIQLMGLSNVEVATEELSQPDVGSGHVAIPGAVPYVPAPITAPLMMSQLASALKEIEAPSDAMETPSEVSQSLSTSERLLDSVHVPPLERSFAPGLVDAEIAAELGLLPDLSVRDLLMEEEEAPPPSVAQVRAAVKARSDVRNTDGSGGSGSWRAHGLGTTADPSGDSIVSEEDGLPLPDLSELARAAAASPEVASQVKLANATKKSQTASAQAAALAMSAEAGADGSRRADSRAAGSKGGQRVRAEVQAELDAAALAGVAAKPPQGPMGGVPAGTLQASLQAARAGAASPPTGVLPPGRPQAVHHASSMLGVPLSARGPMTIQELQQAAREALVKRQQEEQRLVAETTVPPSTFDLVRDFFQRPQQALAARGSVPIPPWEVPAPSPRARRVRDGIFTGFGMVAGLLIGWGVATSASRSTTPDVDANIAARLARCDEGGGASARRARARVQAVAPAEPDLPGSSTVIASGVGAPAAAPAGPGVGTVASAGAPLAEGASVASAGGLVAGAAVPVGVAGAGGAEVSVHGGARVMGRLSGKAAADAHLDLDELPGERVIAQPLGPEPTPLTVQMAAAIAIESDKLSKVSTHAMPQVSEDELNQLLSASRSPIDPHSDLSPDAKKEMTELMESLINVGKESFRNTEYEQAEAYFRRALQLASELNDVKQKENLRWQIGRAYLLRGELIMRDLLVTPADCKVAHALFEKAYTLGFNGERNTSNLQSAALCTNRRPR